ncbi:FecR family protein [Filimonas lacunae]|uniref:FecR family protein n=1 Tax=Filimonas lacunae TaxID=477680 RepID=A0A173MP74_9BACT|nr:FecR family protein [Filimonas lacunae]BAV09286.1 anti-sigma factor [Filimonas lacunae]SIS70495.1 FecR family protein [Filimonas lacunae]
MENKDLIILLEKHTNGQLTAAETIRLMQLLSDDSADDFIKQQIANRLQQSSSRYHMSTEAEQAVLQALLSEIDIAATAPPASRKRAWMIQLTRYAAAAAIIAGISVTIFLLYPTTHKPTPENTTAQTFQVMPGGNKATLTLADGSTIDLDSARAGALAQQNGANITKQSDGVLTYNKASANNNTAVAFNTLRTPRGGQFQVTLPDGSRVWLNAASSLRYPTVFNDSIRNVEVTGEAYFEIASHKAQPFIVTTHNQKVQVLGTRFNVNAYEDENATSTTLLEGSVKVLPNGTPGVVLTSGQQSQVKASNISIKEVAAPDNAIAWKNGYFSFSHASIPAIMRQLARWYNVDIEIQGNFDNQLFTGEIEKNLPLQEVLNGLASTHIHYKMEAGNKLLIIP